MPTISPCRASTPRNPCTLCTVHILARNNRTNIAMYAMRNWRPNSLAAGVNEFDMGRSVFRLKSSLLDRRGCYCVGFRMWCVYTQTQGLGVRRGADVDA